MADVTLNITEYLQLLEAVRELPTIHKRLRHMQDQIDAQRGLIMEVAQKWDSTIVKNSEKNLSITTMP